MRHTKQRIGVITNVAGGSFNDLKMTADKYGVVFDQIAFSLLPLSGIYKSKLLEKICSYDIVYYRTGMRGPFLAELAHILNTKGIPLINGHPDHSFIHLKTRQALIAARHDIPQSDSFYASSFDYKTAAAKLGPTFVIKPDDGSKGSEVTLIHNAEELALFVSNKIKDRYLFQQYIPDADEYRVYTLGNRGIAVYKKERGTNDFRANMHVGGKIVAAEPEIIPKLMRFGSLVANKLGADISAVDILVKGDQMLFLELNCQPGWKQLDKIAGINYCEETIQYLLDTGWRDRSFWSKLLSGWR